MATGQPLLIAPSGLPLLPEHWPVTLDEYHADRTCESNTSLNRFLKDRFAYYLERVRGLELSEQEEADHFRLGRITHLAAQEKLYGAEGLGYRSLIAVLPKGMIRRGKDYQQFCADHADRTILSVKESLAVEGMVEGLLRNRKAVQLLSTDAYVEHAVRWLHEPTGIGLKVCWDILATEGDQFDIKTCCDLAKFKSAVYDNGYYRQAGLYSRARDLYVGGAEALDKPVGSYGRHYHIVIETKPPAYECLVLKTGHNTLGLGWQHVEQILASIKACHEFSDDQSADVWHRSGHGEELELELEDWQFEKELKL